MHRCVGETQATNRVSRRGAVRLAIVLALLVLVVAAAVPPLVSSAPGTAAGHLYAFGDNYHGQLGNATNAASYPTPTEPNPTPTLVTLPGDAGPVTQIAAGYDHSLALTSTGQLYAFGNNYYGQLGNTTNNAVEEPNPTPTLVTLPGEVGHVTQIAAGRYHSLALTSTGQLYAFGYNYFGQLGSTTNNKSEEPNPTPTLVTLPGEVGHVTQIAAGAYHSLALTSTGQLYAFGDNSVGQLGNATNRSGEPNPTPTLVTLPGEVGPVTQIAAGAYHSLALTSTGQLYAFGNNYYGQLGNTTNNAVEEPNPTPTLVTLPSEVGHVTQIAAGANHSLALTSTGQLYAFGENYFGQLGNTTNNRKQEPNPTPTLVTLPSEVGHVTQIAAGANHSLALTSTGQLYAFGENYFGQLGNTTNNRKQEPNPTPTLVTLPGGASIDTMARGPDAYHSLVVAADLAVFSASLPAGVVGVPYSAQVQAVGGAPPYQWAAAPYLPPGLTLDQASGTISGTPTPIEVVCVRAPCPPPTSLSYDPTFTVTDSDGVQASAQLVIAISQRQASLWPSSPPTLLARPSITGAHQSASRWREGHKLAQISRREKPPAGTTFFFSLNEQATVSFRFTQRVNGREIDKKCVGKTRKNVRHKRCKRTVMAGTLSFAGHSGINKVIFQGWLSPSNRLEPSRYLLVISATNAVGTSAPQMLRFTIAK